MALSSTTILSIIELAIYLLLTPLVIYLTFRHRLVGLVGFIFLILFCTLRIVADAIQISHRNGPPSTASAIVGSIGLSPLILALAGFIHEARRYLVDATYAHPKSIKRYMMLVQHLFHVAAIGGLVLLVIGTTGYINATTQQDINRDNGLRRGGAILLLLVWLVLAAYAAWVYLQCRRPHTHRNLKAIAISTIIAAPFIGVRAIYTVAYTCSNNTALNPITGVFAVKLIPIFLVQLLAVLALIGGAYMSRSIARNHPVLSGDGVGYQTELENRNIHR